MTLKPFYTERDDFRRHIDEFAYHQQTLETKVSIWVTDRKVSLTRSNYFTGTNRHSNKRWYRWNREVSYGFFRNASGTIQSFHKYGHKWGVPNAAFSSLQSSRFASKYTRIFKECVEAVFGITELADVYPMAKHYDIGEYTTIPADMVHAFRNSEARPFVEEVFGKKHYRKDLLKATMSSGSASIIDLSSQFRGLVPTDWIVDFLRTNGDIGFFPYGVNIANFRPLFTQLNPKSYRSLLRRELTQRDLMLIENLLRRQGERLIQVNTDRHFRSWAELHDTLIGYRHGYASYHIAPFEEQVIELTPIAKKLDTLPMIAPAMHTSEMVKWGELMNNCIASYRRSAIQGNGEYAAVIKGNKVIGNLEIRGGSLHQLLGRFNRSLPVDIRSEVVNSLNSVGVDTSGNWWGKEEM